MVGDDHRIDSRASSRRVPMKLDAEVLSNASMATDPTIAHCLLLTVCVF